MNNAPIQKINMRDSQFELLRIVAMFFVVLHHLVIKGVDSVGYQNIYNYYNDGIIGVIINSLVIGGVNLFVLISGWYGIRHIGKGFIRLIIDCLVFGIISYIFLWLVPGRPFNIQELFHSSAFVYNWFVVAYMMLLLVSPIIEQSLQHIDDKTFLYWILLLTVFNILFGYCLKQVNSNGYNVVQFIYLYYIARYLKVTKDKKYYGTVKRYSLLLYILLSLLLAGCFIIAGITEHPMSSFRWFAYNNPLVLLSSICLFIWFAELNIKNMIINTAASCVFGIYLLHTTQPFIPWRNALTHNIFTQYGYCGVFAEAVCLFCICGLISFYVNKFNTYFTIHIYNRIRAKFA